MHYLTRDVDRLFRQLDRGLWDAQPFYFEPRADELPTEGQRRAFGLPEHSDDVRRFYVISDIKAAKMRIKKLYGRIKTELNDLGVKGSPDKYSPHLMTDVVRVDVSSAESRPSRLINKEELIRFANSPRFTETLDQAKIIQKIHQHDSEWFRIISQSKSIDVRAIIHKADGTSERIQARKSGVLLCPADGLAVNEVILQFPAQNRYRKQRSDSRSITPEFIIGKTLVLTEPEQAEKHNNNVTLPIHRVTRGKSLRSEKTKKNKMLTKKDQLSLL